MYLNVVLQSKMISVTQKYFSTLSIVTFFVLWIGAGTAQAGHQYRNPEAQVLAEEIRAQIDQYEDTEYETEAQTLAAQENIAQNVARLVALVNAGCNISISPKNKLDFLQLYNLAENYAPKLLETLEAVRAACMEGIIAQKPLAEPVITETDLLTSSNIEDGILTLAEVPTSEAEEMLSPNVQVDTQIQTANVMPTPVEVAPSEATP